MLVIWCKNCGRYIEPIAGAVPIACSSCKSGDIYSLGIYSPSQEPFNAKPEDIMLIENGKEKKEKRGET